MVKKWDGILNESPCNSENKSLSPERPMFLACRSTDNLAAYEENSRALRNSPVRTFIDLKELPLLKEAIKGDRGAKVSDLDKLS